MIIEGLVACICEGGAERTIIELLLDNKLLGFDEEQLLDGEILGKSDRSAKNFERRHLRKEYNEKITVVRILDSYREKFELSKAYKEKVDVINIVTSPEIEMLVILKEDKYKDFQKVKSKKSPSEFCIETLRIRNVKNPDFIREYFADTKILIKIIQEYKRVCPSHSGVKHLADLLK